jgi:hypothetical protein
VPFHKTSTIRPCLAGGLRFGGAVAFQLGADLVNQIAELFGLDAIAFWRHVAMASLEDIEKLAIGAIFGTRGIDEVGDFQIFGNVGFAVAGDAMALGTVVAVDLLALSD